MLTHFFRSCEFGIFAEQIQPVVGRCFIRWRFRRVEPDILDSLAYNYFTVVLFFHQAANSIRNRALTQSLSVGSNIINASFAERFDNRHLRVSGSFVSADLLALSSSIVCRLASMCAMPSFVPADARRLTSPSSSVTAFPNPGMPLMKLIQSATDMLLHLRAAADSLAWINHLSEREYEMIHDRIGDDRRVGQWLRRML